MDAVHFSSQSDTHGTPDHILSAVIAALGGAVDLDPCGDPNRPLSNVARSYYPEIADGLRMPWGGTVFMNPPYGRAIRRWVVKLRDEYLFGPCTAGIALVPARTDTGWWRELEGFPVCLVRGRLSFASPTNQHPAPFPSALFYLGPDTDRFARAFYTVGPVWTRYTP